MDAPWRPVLLLAFIAGTLWNLSRAARALNVVLRGHERGEWSRMILGGPWHTIWVAVWFEAALLIAALALWIGLSTVLARRR
ncbi:MAG: hypothetical protein JO101_11670 [Candidatus Eremiobacteraeota bacterium]|nr:hypothetical protein [Candidatus Eremiobacteraeota bacterium]MBV8355973.1 hypothetical protein [Candidatus Eremiobacteraeota bacterium]